MNLLPPLPPTFITFALAAGGVVAGAPLFAAGRRALHLRQALASLRVTPPDAQTSGLLAMRGRVALEGPMFAPLSGRPCAGYTLEVAGDGMRVGASVSELRAFRLQGETLTARVVSERMGLTTGITMQRVLESGESLPQRLGDLLSHLPEVRWLLDRRVPIRITERALEVGAEVYVMGMARPTRVVGSIRAVSEAAEEAEWAATGTDGAVWTAATGGGGRSASEPALWIEACGPLQRIEIGSTEPDPATLAPSPWRVALVVVGPLLTLAGLLLLARFVAPLIEGRF